MIRAVTHSLDAIREKVEAGARLDAAEAESLWDERIDLHELGELANLVRERKNGNVGYYNINTHKHGYLQVAIALAQVPIFFLMGFVAGWCGGGIDEGVWLGASVVVWGVFLRIVLVWHITWSVNSLSHLFGYRSYETGEGSRNNWLVALLAVGEGWHNNHHADPTAASVQHRWWEFDISYYEIKLLESLGLARDIVRPRHLRARQQVPH